MRMLYEIFVYIQRRVTEFENDVEKPESSRLFTNHGLLKDA